MRYIGNKTRLLPFLLGTIDRLGIRRGVAHDAFAGTAAVGRALKRGGWRVLSSDLMTYSYVFQRAYVVASRPPRLAALRAGDPDLRRALRSATLRQRAAARSPNGRAEPLVAIGEYLAGWLDPERGFLTRHFSPAGGRMYFTEENAARLDAARSALHRWHGAGLLDDDGYYVLLAALIEGADRVANTAGVYAAYIKEWQPNALRPVVIAPERPVPGNGCAAHQGDATAAASALDGTDLLYVDPPYNGRQYAGYYHVPELLARGWFDGTVALRGKTGLVGGPELRSEWCSAQRVQRALHDLLSATHARHVLVSYNSEGLLPEARLEATLAEHAVDGTVRRFSHHYRRYRSDRDRATRRYKRNDVHELLYYARLR